MSEVLMTEVPPSSDISHIVTEDDTPVDNFPSAMQETESLLEQEQRRAKQLAEHLRVMGVEPDQLLG